MLEASLTGESEAVSKDPAPLAEPVALGDRKNMVFKGTAVVQGTGRAIVVATGTQTEMGSIAQMLGATQAEATPLQREAASIGRMLGIAVMIIAVAVVAITLAVSDIRGADDVITVLLLGVSLAVAAVPEGLPAILSVVLALGVRRMAKHKAVVKQLSSVETHGSASVICSDKTGTLTRSEMTIQRVMTASGATHIMRSRLRAPRRDGARRRRRCCRLEGGRGHCRVERRQPRKQCRSASAGRRRMGGAGRSHRGCIPRGGAQTRTDPAAQTTLRAHPRDSVHLRAQDDVDHRDRPRTG